MAATAVCNHIGGLGGEATRLTHENLGKLLETLPQPYETTYFKYRPGSTSFSYEESDDGCPPLSYSTCPSTRSNTTATSICDTGASTPGTEYSSDYYTGQYLDIPKKGGDESNITKFLLNHDERNDDPAALVRGIAYYGDDEDEEDEEDEEQRELERRLAARMEAERQVELALARQQNALEEEKAERERERARMERSSLEDISDDDADDLFNDIESFAKENREKSKAARDAIINSLEYTDEGTVAVRWILKQRQPFARSPQVTWDFKHAPRQPTLVDEEKLEEERAPIPPAPMMIIKGPWLTKEPLLMDDETPSSTVAEEFSLSKATMAEANDDLVSQVFKYLALDQESCASRFDDEMAWNNRWPQKYVAENRFAALKDYIQRYIERTPAIAKGDALW